MVFLIFLFFDYIAQLRHRYGRQKNIIFRTGKRNEHLFLAENGEPYFRPTPP